MIKFGTFLIQGARFQIQYYTMYQLFKEIFRFSNNVNLDHALSCTLQEEKKVMQI